MIETRFPELLNQKAQREKRTIALQEVGRETGLGWRTVSRWAKNRVHRFDDPVLTSLCKYFECEVGDLLVYKKPTAAKNKNRT